MIKECRQVNVTKMNAQSTLHRKPDEMGEGSEIGEQAVGVTGSNLDRGKPVLTK